MFGKILCVERDAAVLKGRCAILKYAGYDTASASPKVADVLLGSQKFDLIVLSKLSDSDLHRIITFADGADVLVLEELTMPAELLSLVAERLDRHRKAQLARAAQRMEALQRVKLDGFEMVISELEVEMDYLRRAKRYLEE